MVTFLHFPEANKAFLLLSATIKSDVK